MNDTPKDPPFLGWMPGDARPPYHSGKSAFLEAVRDFDCCTTLPGTPDPVDNPLDELAEKIAELLEDAVHAEGCYITPDETHCGCLIGRLKGALPQCPAGGGPRDDSGGWRCVRTVHPTTPDAHVFGAV